jgi:hypothetical protein
LPPVGLVLEREGGKHLRTVLGDRLPEDVEVDVEVVMDEAALRSTTKPVPGRSRV